MDKLYLSLRRAASARRVLIALAIFAAIAGFVHWELWDYLQKHDERIRNFALIAAAVFGLPIAAWRSYTAHRGLLNERYQKAAEMLGGELAVRLAGIHALTRMAKRHLTYHVLIMSALSSIVRTHAKRETEHDSGEKELTEDVTVVIEALAARSRAQLDMEVAEEYCLDLRSTDLRGLRVNETKLPRAILDDANLSDQVNKAVFYEADFREASLVNASLAFSRLHIVDFTGADLLYVNLAGADLFMVGLLAANLREADFSGAHFGFMVDLSEADLTKADFSGANFGVEVEMEDAILDETILANVTGLTQKQLNSAKIDPSNPPILTGSIDPDTQKPLVVPA